MFFINLLWSFVILSFQGLILVKFVSHLTIYIIIDIFTPFHIFLLYIIADIIIFIIGGGFGEVTHISITYIIFFISCIFMILVFIEIIQLNFFGLSTMTKKNIEERARFDAFLNDDNDDEEESKEENKDVKEDNGNDKYEQVISMKGYFIELKDLDID